jgi:hypothetical protein
VGGTSETAAARASRLLFVLLGACAALGLLPGVARASTSQEEAQAVVIGALALALVWLVRRRRGSGPLDVLDRPLLGLGVLIGVLIEGHDSSRPPTLQADEIGNVTDGRTLFVTQGCSMCHSFEGQGG